MEISYEPHAAEQLKKLESLHECSAALRDLQLLDTFVSRGGVGVWDVTMSRGHGDKQVTYKIQLTALLPALTLLEEKLRGTLSRNGYDISALPQICVTAEQNRG